MKQLSLMFDDKEAEAISFLQQHEPPEGYFLGFSGGKDSQVVYHLAKQAGVKFTPYYSCTTIDPPELVKFIRTNYPDVIWMKPKLSFLAALKKKGFPTRLSRWCCDYLKKDPTKHVPLKHRIMGIRAEESRMRAARPKIDYFKKFKQTIYKPVFTWLEWEVWEYLEKYNIPHCELYDTGFGRIGCMVCPFICHQNGAKLKMAKAQWPKFYKAFEHAMAELYYRKEWWRQTKQRRAMTFDEFLTNWYAGVGYRHDLKREK